MMIAETSIKTENFEALRLKMRLSTAQMASLLRISRASYYNWRMGNPIKPENVAHAKRVYKALLFVASEYQWPSGSILAMSSAKRFARLKTLLPDVE